MNKDLSPEQISKIVKKMNAKIKEIKEISNKKEEIANTYRSLAHNTGFILNEENLNCFLKPYKDLIATKEDELFEIQKPFGFLKRKDK